MPVFREKCEEWIEQPEDVLSYALFPQVAEEFFEYRRAQKTGISARQADRKNQAYPL